MSEQPTNPKPGTLSDLFDRITRKAPEYYDLLTAETDEEFDHAFTPFLERAVTGLEKKQ